MKNLFIALMLITITGITIHAQKRSTADIEQVIASRNFIFKAQSVTPQTGGFRQLTTSDYDVIITKDTVISWLPYFGRAYTAPIDPSESGIRFTSSKFEYTQTKDDKHGWNITIKPKDVRDIQTLYLEVFENGTASLQVTSLNRQSISFRGYITENEKSKKKAF